MTRSGSFPTTRASGLAAACLLAALASAQSIRLNGPLAQPGSGDVTESRVSPDGAWVVYLADQELDETYDLFSVPSAGGAEPIRLNPTPVVGRSVARFEVAAAGGRVVFLANLERGLYSVPLDGSAAALELFPPLAPDRRIVEFHIDPRGSRVVYTADQDQDEVYELYSAPVDASQGPVRISGSLVPGGDVAWSPRESHVAISPDGTRVLYRADQEQDGAVQLYSAPIEGAALPLRLSGPLVALGGVVDFALSADSRWVVYRANQEQVDSLELFSAPIDGRREALRLHPPLVADGDVGAFTSYFGEFIQPDSYRITPDGRRVVYWADQEEEGLFELFSAPIEGFGRQRARRIGHGTILELSGELGPGESLFPFESFELDSTGSRAVYLRFQDGAQQLFSAPVDRRGGEVRISDSLPLGADVYSYWVNPHGEQVLYYTSFGELYSVPSDGHLPALELGVSPSLEGEDDDFTFSPDGMRVVFRTYELGRHLVSMELDGTGTVELGAPHHGVQTWISGVQLASGGTRVVYSADPLETDVLELFSAPLDGSLPAVKLSGELLPGGPVRGTVADFQISPDGRRVVYRADQDLDDVYELYSAQLHGKKQRIKLHEPFVPGRSVPRAGFQVAPDSMHVAFIADADTNDVHELYGVPIDGSGPPVKLSASLTTGGDVRSGLLFTPDGSRVLYLADAELDERFELYAAPIDGSAAAVKLSGPLVAGGDVQPNEADPNYGLNIGFLVSPHGAWVVYRADQTACPRIAARLPPS